LLKTKRHGNPVMREITFSEADVQAIAHERYHRVYDTVCKAKRESIK
jgi:hypothetical protein